MLAAMCLTAHIYMEQTNLVPEYYCSVQMGFHEVGCRHLTWEAEDLHAALDVAKIRLQVAEALEDLDTSPAADLK